ncbi:MAG TPA: KTSC domain-containing protein [Caulobacteraceae bacterium]|jgi:lysyl-tRNA synthetase class 2|nr:KTSC domain-containing protein [Caulobacteraceae bacterium]
MDVVSSAIRRIRYDRERGKLFVRFAGGDEYLYVGVPEEVHRDFVEAPSKGGFFARQIRDRYPYNRLD